MSIWVYLRITRLRFNQSSCFGSYALEPVSRFWDLLWINQIVDSTAEMDPIWLRWPFSFPPSQPARTITARPKGSSVRDAGSAKWTGIVNTGRLPRTDQVERSCCGGSGEVPALLRWCPVWTRLCVPGFLADRRRAFRFRGPACLATHSGNNVVVPRRTYVMGLQC